MPWRDIIWTDENERHLAAHGVSRQEAEEVLLNPDEEGRSRTSGRPMCRGYTRAGRYIVVVYEELDEITVYPITAYEP